jgi:hypothetical protein
MSDAAAAPCGRSFSTSFRVIAASMPCVTTASLRGTGGTGGRKSAPDRTRAVRWRRFSSQRRPRASESLALEQSRQPSRSGYRHRLAVRARGFAAWRKPDSRCVPEYWWSQATFPSRVSAMRTLVESAEIRDRMGMSAYQRIAKIADPNVDAVKLENIVQRVMASDLRQPACRRGVARAPGPQAESTRNRRDASSFSRSADEQSLPEHRASEERKSCPMIGTSERKEDPSDEGDERPDGTGRAD